MNIFISGTEHVAGKHSFVAEHLFDAEELVLLCQAVSTAHRARLYLPRAEADREVGDGRVFRFARAMRDNRAPARRMRHIHRRDGLRERPYLIDLYQYRVRGILADAALKE